MTEHDRDATLRRMAQVRVGRRGFLTAASLGGAGNAARCVQQRLEIIRAVTGRGIGTGRVRWSRRIGKRRVGSAEADLHTDVESDFNLYNWVDYDAPGDDRRASRQEYRTRL